ncbi:MAG: penicillin-binding transpeptidase domain-containing protein [Elusimicrobiota bacterium]
MTNNSVFFDKIRRRNILEHISNICIPDSISRIIESQSATEFEKYLAINVLKIEMSVRPKFARIIEFISSGCSGLSALLFKSNLRNYTVSQFQIGILTSLQWTRSKISIINYFKRFVLLLSSKGSCRIFKIGVHKFLKSYKDRSKDIFTEFAIFYNGMNTSSELFAPYYEVLNELMRKYDLHYDIERLYNPIAEFTLPMGLNITNNRSSIKSCIDERINLRLDKIKSLIAHGDNLCAVLILCSVSKRMIIYSHSYGSKIKPCPVIESERVIGSLVKIPLYSAYIEKYNSNPNDVFIDKPISISWKNTIITPKNADKRYRGDVTLEYAFANSINTIAIQIVNKVGVDNFISYLRKCGIKCPLPYNPLLALGPIKLTGYEVLSTLSPILNSGHLSVPMNKYISAPINNGELLISKRTVNLMSQLLGSTIQYGTGKYLASYKKIVTGGKTGTSDGNKDLWFIGIHNSDIYGLVWLGFADEQPIRSLDNYPTSASRYAVPLWSSLLDLSLNELT